MKKTKSDDILVKSKSMAIEKISQQSLTFQVDALTMIIKPDIMIIMKCNSRPASTTGR